MAQRIEVDFCPRCGHHKVDIFYMSPRFAWDKTWMEWECPRCGECEQIAEEE